METKSLQLVLIGKKSTLRNSIRRELDAQFSVQECVVASTKKEIETTLLFGPPTLYIVLATSASWAYFLFERTEHPIIIVRESERDSEVDAIVALRDGIIEGYCTFSRRTKVLSAYIHVVLRHNSQVVRSESVSPTHCCVGSLKVGMGRYYIAQLNGNRLELTEQEYKLLQIFAQEPGAILISQYITAQLWPGEMDRDARLIALRMVIRRLRQKLAAVDSNHQYIHTHRGVGYKLEARPPQTQDEVPALA